MTTETDKASGPQTSDDFKTMWRLPAQEDSAGTHGAPRRGWGQAGKGQQAKDIFLQEVTDVLVRSAHVQGGEIWQGSCRGGTWRGARIPKSLTAFYPHIAGPLSEWSEAHSFDICSPPSGLFLSL